MAFVTWLRLRPRLGERVLVAARKFQGRSGGWTVAEPGSSFMEVRGVIVGAMIRWKPDQKKRVATALRRHPRTSDRCARAAKAILPVALEVDGVAHARVIEPEGAVYVQPKDLDVRWSHHVTVAVDAHHVDALTGPPGHDQAAYLEHFFDEPESHSIRPVAPDELGKL